MQYTSKNPGLTMIIRDAEVDYSQPGRPRTIKDVLTVEFGQYGSAIHPSVASGSVDEHGNPKMIHQRHEFGNEIIFADFRGGFIDLEEMIVRKKAEKLWTDEDADLVRREMEDACDNPLNPHYGLIERHVPQAPTAPWPTYDDMHPSAVAEQAQLLGLLGPAMMYEAATLNRPEVLAEMETLAKQAEALTAA